MEDEREEGEIVDVNDDDIYETIISSDEVDEDDLRQRIEELEAKNSELEKIASISKTYDYGLGCGSNYIDLVDDGGDDDESYYRQPSKYDYSSYPSSRKRSRSKRRRACRHESKKSKRYKPYKVDKRKKTLPNRTRASSDSSSDDEFQLDRSKLQAALKRNTTSFHSSTTLKRKLIGVSKTVEDFIKAKEDVGDEDISTSIEIMHLLNKINIEEIAPKAKSTVEEEAETETGLNEQELRIIALKSAILKKAEARKKRKIIETQPYSPTDDVAIESVLGSKASVQAKPKDDLDNNMEISPAVSPINQDGCLQPIDMELESDDENQMEDAGPADIATVTAEDLQQSTIVPVPDDMSLSNAHVPEEDTDRDQSPVDTTPPDRKLPDEEDEEALRALLLANMRATKKKSSSKDTPSTQQQPIIIDEDPLPVEKSNSTDAAVEVERLRKQVFSSMGKRKESHRHLLPNPFAQKFSVQVPKPMPMPMHMEMTMPQITSNLKEALKRIKEQHKQIVEPDVVVGTAKTHPPTNVVAETAKEILVEVAKCKTTPTNVVAETAKEILVDFAKCKTTQAELIELKIIAHKLNGANVLTNKITPPDAIETAKKSTEPSNKVNDVLKNVTCNNASVETKTKDGATVPLVKSNKIEIGPVEKSDAAIRALKTVAQKKVTAEPHASLNQKENQQLRKVGASPKRTSEEKLLTAKKLKLANNVKVSRVITTPVEKPVKKLIIQLNNSDTESDDFGLGQSNTETSGNSKSYSGVASPVSFNLFSPSSPANVADSKAADAVPSNNDSFQRKLDEYLKSARTKVELKKQEMQPIKKSASLVSHLPPSSQLEYRKLIIRMGLLEKEKLLKLSQSKAVAPKPKPIGNISVTITNELCNLQPKADEQIVQVNGNHVASPPKEKQKEHAAKMQGPDPEIPVATKNVSRIPAANVVSDSGIISNNSSAPEVNVTRKQVVTAQPKETETPNKFLQNFAALSEEEKNDLLQKSVAEYMSHSELYLVDLNTMSQLVNQARQEKEKQFQTECEIETLEARVQVLKKQLATQKASVSKLYPIISTSHKNIMKKRSKSLMLNKKCYYYGNKVVGADYKIPGDPKADIAQKVKSLSSETKQLRNMKKPADSGANSTVTSISTEDTSLPTEHVNEHTPAAGSDDATTLSTPSENPDDVNHSTINGGPSDNIPYSKMKYHSPLDHMKNIGVTNPDSIVCPFQLLGQCEDRECTYQHLS